MSDFGTTLLANPLPASITEASFVDPHHFYRKGRQLSIPTLRLTGTHDTTFSDTLGLKMGFAGLFPLSDSQMSYG
jgi:hypothetical protein